MPAQTTTKKIPNPLYAAAGAGDLAYRELRKLPERVAELRDTVSDAVSDAVTDARRSTDINYLRRVARRNAEAFVSGVEAAQSSAVAVYRGLVRRGERVVGRNVRATSARVAVDPGAKTVRAQVGIAPEPTKSTAAKSAPAKRTGRPAAKRTTTASKRTSAAAKRTTSAAKSTGRPRKAPAKRTAAK